MFSVSSSGSFNRTIGFLTKVQAIDLVAIVTPFAQQGVAALESATPVDSGLAAHSWGYEISKSGGGITIAWTNNDVENGFPVAIMLQYGHGTGTGGYVRGQDYINPAIRPIFDKIAEEVWKAVTSA